MFVLTWQYLLVVLGLRLFFCLCLIVSLVVLFAVVCFVLLVDLVVFCFVV